MIQSRVDIRVLNAQSVDFAVSRLQDIDLLAGCLSIIMTTGCLASQLNTNT
jgi:hypothetical protein